MDWTDCISDIRADMTVSVWLTTEGEKFWTLFLNDAGLEEVVAGPGGSDSLSFMLSCIEVFKINNLIVVWSHWSWLLCSWDWFGIWGSGQIAIFSRNADMRKSWIVSATFMLLKKSWVVGMIRFVGIGCCVYCGGFQSLYLWDLRACWHTVLTKILLNETICHYAGFSWVCGRGNRE